MNFTRSLLVVAVGASTPLFSEEDSSSPMGHHVPGPIHQHHSHASESGSPFGAAISLGYDSRYVSEGRDNLFGDSLLHGALEFSMDDFLFGLWYADSPENPYNEFNAHIEYGFQLGDVEGYLGYTHLRFPDDDDHDNEIALSFSYGKLPWGLTTGLDMTYSFDADGVFLEASLTREFTPCDWLTLGPGIVFGWNEGYVSSGHRGANHVAALIAAMVPLGDTVELAGYLSYNMAIDSSPLQSPDDLTLDDFLYGGLSVNFVF